MKKPRYTYQFELGQRVADYEGHHAVILGRETLEDVVVYHLRRVDGALTYKATEAALANRFTLVTETQALVGDAARATNSFTDDELETFTTARRKQ